MASMPEETLMRRESRSCEGFLCWIGGRRIVTLRLWNFLSYGEKTIETLHNRKTIRKSCIYRFIAAEDMWRKCGRWMASSNGQDLSREGVVKAEENFESGSSIAQRSTVGSRKWKVKNGKCWLGDEIWTVDLQIRSMMEISWMPHCGPVNCWASSVSDSHWMASLGSDGVQRYRIWFAAES